MGKSWKKVEGEKETKKITMHLWEADSSGHNYSERSRKKESTEVHDSAEEEKEETEKRSTRHKFHKRVLLTWDKWQWWKGALGIDPQEVGTEEKWFSCPLHLKRACTLSLSWIGSGGVYFGYMYISEKEKKNRIGSKNTYHTKCFHPAIIQI